ncbi:MAG TPA: cytochrome c maturation protein CcmE [Bacteroidia bacterium]|nr:cytochrome c maturation protein CcmE [Bacteroidia bacterium]
MKRSHIIGIIVIAVMLGVIVSTISDSSTYAPFSKAIEHEGKSYHVVGKLNKEKEFIYNPTVNANIFGFYLIDNEGKEMKVLYNDHKPQDFEKSEQIVVIGKVVGDEFHVAKGDLLMKCPSKYNGNQATQDGLTRPGA